VVAVDILKGLKFPSRALFEVAMMRIVLLEMDEELV
jgi:hypothetical protein